MYRRGDPRWNRTIQHISENIEHANEAAQENIYGFTQSYVNPCCASLTACCNALTAPCFPSSDDRRRHRGRSRGRAELSFDFYDDWDDDETDGLLGGWGNDNLGRFLGSAATYGATQQPGRQRAMSYGPRARDPRFAASRRKSTAPAREGPDPTVIPASSYFGFLGRLPFNLGSKGLRYKPSAADLTERPAAWRRSAEETQPLVEDSDEDHARDYKAHRRARSDTHTSGHTTDSFSSRGDIFPSGDELDDAVPLDDEFTIALERRTTGQWDDSAKSTGSGRNTRSNSKPPSSVIEEPDVPTLDELGREEDGLRREEDADVERKRAHAHHLAIQRGLAPSESPASEHLNAPEDVVPLPNFGGPATPDRPVSPADERPVTAVRIEATDAFVPARLPHFG
ncbi:uncharacterized protein M421DRAFT_91440 [Didymella exigua CBS 183.55]|uniref:Uncharacterized protein n=1 Tax=Didymella exigua CBS 183.55 TaxID=1150837 RepID=A0A6A5RQY6_9PLEO|nr:uncharacterized protein M421DRAFT_91440 [Didymella exigua CBS 183.55]KAF1929588.1 hypothetical protein M421DRAFT_91440 [Didymella exigua CBS 183.55]